MTKIWIAEVNFFFQFVRDLLCCFRLVCIPLALAIDLAPPASSALAISAFAFSVGVSLVVSSRLLFSSVGMGRLWRLYGLLVDCSHALQCETLDNPMIGSTASLARDLDVLLLIG